MSQQLMLSRKKPQDIAFVIACAAYGAITKAEFFQWLDWAMTQIDEIPTYFFDLLEHEKDPKFDASSVSGILPTVEGREDKAINALIAIAYQRGLKNPNSFDTEIGSIKSTLEESAHTMVQFRQLFPFLDLSNVG